MAEYFLSDFAAKTLEDIYEYSYRSFGKLQAREYYASLERTFDLLADQPGMGRSYHGYRRHVHGKHIILYRERDQAIEILFIFHEKENLLEKIQDLL